MKAFAGPLALKERLGAVDADTLACADWNRCFFEQARGPPLSPLDGQAGA